MNSLLLSLEEVLCVAHAHLNLVCTTGAVCVTQGMGSHAKWPAWMLFIALVMLVVSVTSVLPIPRLLFALVLATCLGLYISGMYFPFSVILYSLVVAMVNLVAILLVCEDISYGSDANRASSLHDHHNIALDNQHSKSSN